MEHLPGVAEEGTLVSLAARSTGSVYATNTLVISFVGAP